MKVSEVVPCFVADQFRIRRLKLCRLMTNYFTLLEAIAGTGDDQFNINSIDSICTIKEGAVNIINAIGTAMFSVASTNYNEQVTNIKHTILNTQMVFAINFKIQRTTKTSIIHKDD